MGKAESREDWWVIRQASKRQDGPKKEIGPLTHRGARSTAHQLHIDGWDVTLHRRVGGKMVKKLEPQFPGTKRRTETRKTA